jgi:hypothetical protein
MKRSEILNHIKEDLVKKLNHSKFSKGSEVWSEFVANELLDMLEGFGMLPPEVKTIPQHVIDNGESANYWESENE